MSDQKFLYGVNETPMTKWASLLTLHDGMHARYSAIMNGADILLFDTMHVDARFHIDEDPLHGKYPPRREIIDEISEQNQLRGIDLLTQHLVQVRAMYEDLASALGVYTTKEELPKELIKKTGLFAKVAIAYHDLGVETSLSAISTMARAAASQKTFLDSVVLMEAAEKSGSPLQETGRHYSDLQQAGRALGYAMNCAVTEYNAAINFLYDGKSPFPDTPPGNSESSQLMPLEILKMQVRLTSRPFTQHLVARELDSLRKDLSDFADVCKEYAARQGRFSTRPDLRGLTHM